MVGKVDDEVNTDGVSNWRGAHRIVIAGRAFVAIADRQ